MYLERKFMEHFKIEFHIYMLFKRLETRWTISMSFTIAIIALKIYPQCK